MSMGREQYTDGGCKVNLDDPFRRTRRLVLGTVPAKDLSVHILSRCVDKV
jgi:hypothetical protein